MSLITFDLLCWPIRARNRFVTPRSKLKAEFLPDVISTPYPWTGPIVTTHLPVENGTEAVGSERLILTKTSE